MRVLLAMVVLVMLAAPAVGAHEGHAHKIMGTIASVRADRLDIKATDGKTASVVLNDKTKILRGTESVKTKDLKIGERIVATAMEQKNKTMVATELRVAAGR
jgi:hypothetical protein